MKNWRFLFLALGALSAFILIPLLHAQPQPSPTPAGQTQPPSNPPASQAQPPLNPSAGQPLKIGIVNTKRCLDESKLGKQEKSNFEKMEKQMESILQDKGRELEEIESKINDDDYMDSVSDEVASELKRKRRTLKTEGAQLQSQYVQTLQQANFKIVQKITDAIAKASAQVAQDTTSGQPIEVIFTDEACTYYAPHLDVSGRVVAKMDAMFDAEQKENAAKSH